MNGNEKKTEKNIKISSDNKFLRWLDNFWYHYKGPALGVIFAFVIIAVCSVQMFTKEKHDITVIYAGPTQYVVGLDELIESLLPEDYNKDGEKLVAVNSYTVYSREQIEALEAETDDEGVKLYSIDRSYNSNQYTLFQSDMQTGNASVCFLDPWIYAEFSKEHLCSMSEIFGDELPVGVTEDGYGIRLGDTAIYNEFAVLKNMPADTVICLERALVTEQLSKDAQKKYDFEKAVFSAIVNYVPTEVTVAQADTLYPVDDKRYSLGAEL